MANVQLNTLGATIKTTYEAEANTNAFTDAEQTKLAGIETGATANTGELADLNKADLPAAVADYRGAGNETLTAALAAKAESADLGDLAVLEVTLPADSNQCLDGLGAFSAKNPPQVSPGEITAGTETAIRSWSPADVVSANQQHGGGGGSGGIDWGLNASTTLTVGNTIDGQGHLMTSDSAVTVTLSNTATVDTQVAVAKGGSGTVTVQVAGGAGYWAFGGEDLGGTPATASFTINIAYFTCIRNTSGVAAEWTVAGSTSLDSTILGDLAIGGDLSVTGAVNIPANSLEIAETSGLQAALDALKVETITGHIVTAANKTYVLDQSAAYSYNINTLIIDAGSGTCTARLTIDGVNVTGISAVSVSTTEATGTASGANSVAVGSTVALVISSNSAATDVVFTVKTTRT